MALLMKFKSIDAIINATSKELKEIPGITHKIIQAIKALQ
jgi:excinuclease UvrABC nuclease subunit